ncbi:MAG: EAL domain-containing protein [Campylobacter ureolyticus]|uniref:EAL domain-containing protein n=1 Tax=Campylobacter ureolyticus TaxID=827 RepID=UPI0022B4F9C2|nr:EAL domain-containing protein [Campylobacter ureolyticus]MCZ6104287.1 EAL domain-containing protein [Campylobacter ureolyticus]MDU4982112.1 EAL domain-containing protein [Campylobacter ureolyticus]
MTKLFSEEKERSKRFVLSLKIAFPLVLVLIILIFLMFSENNYDWKDTILFVILIVCYVYYVVYFIYFAFQNTTLDQVSNVFNRKEILKLISKELKENSQKNIALVNINNIQDINFRYGYKNGDKLLKEFVLELADFFKKNGYKDIPIGRHSGGNFLFVIDCKTPQLNYYLKTFERKLSNQGINNIEVKIKFATVETNYDKAWENVINYLFSKILYSQNEEEIEVIKLDALDEFVCHAIDNSKFELKAQTIKSMKNDKDIINLSINLALKDVGNVTKLKVMEIATRNNYEIKYDLKVIEFIANNFNFKKFNSKVMIEISPVSLRNAEFKNEIHRLITNKIIDPNKIIFEIYEKDSYNEMLRFNEIIEQFRGYGFEIAMNQFLGNNASFEYFKYLNFGYLIYDLEVNKKFNEERMRNIFDMINENASKFNLKTIIRFVDKNSFYEKLKETEIDYIQGFCIDKPKVISQ